MGFSTAELLPREQVATALARALDAPLVLLIAPMGYGKTTAARNLAAALPFPSFDLSVPQGAENARWLWDFFCSQVVAEAEQRGDDAALALLLKNLGFPGDNAAVRRVLDHIHEDMAGRRILLIIDDWHFAACPEFDAFLERLIRENIPGLTLFLLSRTRPAFALEDLRIKGLANVFGQDLLTFTEDEAAAYFALHGVGDTLAAIAAWKLCEGWPAALWLALEAYKQHPAASFGQTGDASRALPVSGPGGCGGHSPPVVSLDTGKLLESVVFPQYSPEEQRLLMQCSVLESFSPEQAARITDNPAASEALRRLLENNAFLSRDPVSGLYRIHSMFRAFLAEKLDATKDIDKAALCRRAGESQLLSGELLRAALFFHQAGRDEDLLRLLEVFTLPRGNLLLFLSADTIIPLVQSIPWQLRAKRPVAYLAFIYFYFAECDPLAALPLLEEAETRFAEDPSIAASLKRRIQGEVILIRGILAFNDLWAMSEVHKAAHELLSGRSAISSRHMIWNFACPHASSLYLREPGSYGDMIALIEDNLHYFHDLSDGCSLGAELLFRAEYMLERGEFAEVESILRAAVMRAQSKEQITVMLAAAFSLARLYAVTGRETEAPALLREWVPKIHALGHVDLSTCLDLSLGYLAACLGLPNDIPAWLREGEFSPAQSVAQMAGFIQAVHGKALVLSGDPARLDAVARLLPASLGPFNNLFVRIHGKIQEALAARQAYGVENALEALEAALDLARPDGIVLTVAEYGSHVLPLLRTLHKRKPKDAYLARLVRLAASYPRMVNSRASSRMHNAALTPRETEVLLCAAKGNSNREIAKRLGIALITAKKLLSSAYAKLGAKNRVEAVRSFMESTDKNPRG